MHGRMIILCSQHSTVVTLIALNQVFHKFIWGFKYKFLLILYLQLNASKSVARTNLSWRSCGDNIVHNYLLPVALVFIFICIFFFSLDTFYKTLLPILLFKIQTLKAMHYVFFIMTHQLSFSYPSSTIVQHLVCRQLSTNSPFLYKW